MSHLFVFHIYNIFSLFSSSFFCVTKGSVFAVKMMIEEGEAREIPLRMLKHQTITIIECLFRSRREKVSWSSGCNPTIVHKVNRETKQKRKIFCLYRNRWLLPLRTMQLPLLLILANILMPALCPACPWKLLREGLLGMAAMDV